MKRAKTNGKKPKPARMTIRPKQKAASNAAIYFKALFDETKITMR
jgi:hypothetical protein